MSDNNSDSNDKFGKILQILKYVAIGFIIVNVIAFVSGALGWFDKSGLGDLFNKAMAFFGDLLDDCRTQGVCSSNYQKTAKECNDANCDWQESGYLECSDPNQEQNQKRIDDCIAKKSTDCCCGVDCPEGNTNDGARCIYQSLDESLDESGTDVVGCFTKTSQPSSCTYKSGRPEGSGGTFTPKCFLLYLILIPSILGALLLLYGSYKLFRLFYSNQDKDAKNLSALTGEKTEDIVKRWADDWRERGEEASEREFEESLELNDETGELKFNLNDGKPFEDDKKLNETIDKLYEGTEFEKDIIEKQKSRIKELRKTLRRQRFTESKYRNVSRGYSTSGGDFSKNIKSAGENYTKAAKEITKMVDKSKHMTDEDKKTIKEQTDSFKETELEPKK